MSADLGWLQVDAPGATHITVLDASFHRAAEADGHNLGARLPDGAYQVTARWGVIGFGAREVVRTCRVQADKTRELHLEVASTAASYHKHPALGVPHNEPHPNPAELSRHLADTARGLRRMTFADSPAVDNTWDLVAHLGEVVGDLADVVAQVAQGGAR